MNKEHTYTITYSVGTTRNDEKRYQIRGIQEKDLARRITTMVAKSKIIYSIERETSM